MPLPKGFYEKLPSRSDNELFEMLTNSEDYIPEALEAATKELENRGVPAERLTDLYAQAETKWIERNKKEKELEKRKLFAKIESQEDALTNLKAASYCFWVVAGIQATLAFHEHSALGDAAIWAVLAAILFRWHSRVAAVLLVLMSVLTLVVTILNLLGILSIGGRNIFMAFVVFLLALRTVQAAFKYHEFCPPN
jgi:predicted RND superfamily exporter protein